MTNPVQSYGARLRFGIGILAPPMSASNHMFGTRESEPAIRHYRTHAKGDSEPFSCTSAAAIEIRWRGHSMRSRTDFYEQNCLSGCT